MAFEKATKKRAKLRLAMVGPAKSGKTKTSLLIAKHLGKRVAVIDTERGSASKYAGDVADFDVEELTNFAPAKYLAAMREAASAGYDVLLIDSLSHAWIGEGGILDQKDKGSGGNNWGVWRTLTPQHNDLVDSILAWPGHVIVTMRTKTEYVVEQVNGKSVPRRIGLAPVQRDGMEYEFDVLAEMDRDHTMHVTDTRCEALDGVSIRKPTGAEIAKELLGWLNTGAAPAAPPKLPVDVVIELALTGYIERAKEAARKAWKQMSPDEKARAKTAIDDAEIAEREAQNEAHPDPHGTEAAGQ